MQLGDMQAHARSLVWFLELEKTIMNISHEQKSSLGSDGYFDRNYGKQCFLPKQKPEGKNQLGTQAMDLTIEMPCRERDQRHLP